MLEEVEEVTALRSFERSRRKLVIIPVLLAVKFPVSGDNVATVAPASHSLLGATYLPIAPKMIDSFQITQ